MVAPMLYFSFSGGVRICIASISEAEVTFAIVFNVSLVAVGEGMVVCDVCSAGIAATAVTFSGEVTLRRANTAVKPTVVMSKSAVIGKSKYFPNGFEETGGGKATPVWMYIFWA